jgi:hypothetical protein
LYSLSLKHPERLFVAEHDSPSLNPTHIRSGRRAEFQREPIAPRSEFDPALVKFAVQVPLRNAVVFIPVQGGKCPRPKMESDVRRGWATSVLS